MKNAIIIHIDAIVETANQEIMGADTLEKVEIICSQALEEIRGYRFDKDVLSLSIRDHKEVTARIDMAISTVKECRWAWAVQMFGKEED